MKSISRIAVAVVAATLFSTDAFAVARTFVSGSGNDANTTANCTKAQPCRSFAAALTVTAIGGEIVVLDSANYLTVTINKAVTIVAPEGVIAAIHVGNSATGITVAAPGQLVVLRNLTITAADSASNTTGINHTGGFLMLYGTTVSGLNLGMASVAKSWLIDSNFWSNDVALRVTGEGCTNTTPPSCGNTVARLKGGNFVLNDVAIFSVSATAGKSNILEFVSDPRPHFADNGTTIFGEAPNAGLSQMIPYFPGNP